MTTTKRIVIEIIAVLWVCFCFMNYAIVAHAAVDAPSPKNANGASTDAPEPSGDSTDQNNEVFYAPYYDEGLSIAEVYSNVDPTTTKYLAIEYGTSSEQPMLAAYTDDPNWGDHRQFARMVPIIQDSGLTAGDAVAKIILYPDMEYYLVEYLVNTAVAGENPIEGLKLFVDFPTHLDAGEEGKIYAYLESENDAGGSRVCWVNISSEKEIWLTSTHSSVSCLKAWPQGGPGEKTTAGPYLAEIQSGLKIDDFGTPRSTISVEWPEACKIAGGVENGYFATLALHTHGSSPFVQEVVITSIEEFEAAIADDPNMQQGYTEDDSVIDDPEITHSEVTRRELTTIEWVILVVILVVVVIMAVITIWLRYQQIKMREEREKGDKS